MPELVGQRPAQRPTEQRIALEGRHPVGRPVEVPRLVEQLECVAPREVHLRLGGLVVVEHDPAERQIARLRVPGRVVDHDPDGHGHVGAGVPEPFVRNDAPGRAVPVETNTVFAPDGGSFMEGPLDERRGNPRRGVHGNGERREDRGSRTGRPGSRMAGRCLRRGCEQCESGCERERGRHAALDGPRTSKFDVRVRNDRTLCDSGRAHVKKSTATMCALSEAPCWDTGTCRGFV
jgi:hypothetical protein